MELNRGRTPLKAVRDDGQWRSSITSSTWPDRISFKECTSSRRAQRKVLQQLCGDYAKIPTQLSWAEGRIHGGESVRGSRHKVASSGSNHRSSSSRHRTGGSAGPKELQREPNVGHLKCHKPVCGNCARRAEVICDQWSQRLFFCFWSVSSFFDYYYHLFFNIKC